MKVANTLAYSDTAVKSYIVQAPESLVTKKKSCNSRHLVNRHGWGILILVLDLDLVLALDFSHFRSNSLLHEGSDLEKDAISEVTWCQCCETFLFVTEISWSVLG
jgi:hypothetical protein